MMLGISLPHHKLQKKIHAKLFGGGSKKKKRRARRRARAVAAAAAAAQQAAAAAAQEAPAPSALPATVPADPFYTTYTPPIAPMAPSPYVNPVAQAIPADPFYSTYTPQPQLLPAQFYDAGPSGGTSWADPFNAPEAEDPFEQAHDFEQMDVQPELVPGYDDGEPEPLEGIFDSDYWRQKWDDTVAWFQAQVASFFSMKYELTKRRQVLDRAIATAQVNPQRVPASTLARLQGLKRDLSATLARQGELEGKVTEQLKKVNLVTEQKATGMGVAFLIPIAIGAAAVATMVAVGGAVVIHMRNSADLNKQIDMVAAGVLSADQVERIKDAGPAGDLLGLGNLKTLGYLALGGVALYFVAPMLMGRRRA